MIRDQFRDRVPQDTVESEPEEPLLPSKGSDVLQPIDTPFFSKAPLLEQADFALLLEFPSALRRLATLVAASPWAADYLAGHPMLLDEIRFPDPVISQALLPAKNVDETKLAEALGKMVRKGIKVEFIN